MATRHWARISNRVWSQEKLFGVSHAVCEETACLDIVFLGDDWLPENLRESFSENGLKSPGRKEALRATYRTTRRRDGESCRSFQWRFSRMELGLDGSQFVGWESGHTLWCACVQRRSSKENRYFSSPVIYQHIVGAQKLNMEFVNHIAVDWKQTAPGSFH